MSYAEKGAVLPSRKIAHQVDDLAAGRFVEGGGRARSLAATSGRAMYMRFRPLCRAALGNR
jgi:hypothetical protein